MSEENGTKELGKRRKSKSGRGRRNKGTKTHRHRDVWLRERSKRKKEEGDVRGKIWERKRREEITEDEGGTLNSR